MKPRDSPIHKDQSFQRDLFEQKKDSFKANLTKDKVPRNNYQSVRSSDNQILTRHPIMKLMALYFLIGGTSYYSFKYCKQQLIKNKPQIFNTMMNHSLLVLIDNIHQKMVGPESQTKKMADFANKELLRRIKEDQLYLKLKIQQKTLFKNVNSCYGLGILRLGAIQTSEVLSQEGNIMAIKKKCLLKIGGISVLGYKHEQLIKEGECLRQYKKIEQLGLISEHVYKTACQGSNLVNRIIESSDRYEKLMEECVQNISGEFERIKGEIRRVKSRVQKKNRNSYFVFS